MMILVLEELLLYLVPDLAHTLTHSHPPHKPHQAVGPAG